MQPMLLALLEEHLHADADSEHGTAVPRRVPYHPAEAPGLDLLHGGAERAVSGEHEGVRLRDLLRVPSEHRLRPHVAEALGDAAQVAQPVVDDGDHRLPLVLGTSRTRGSRAVAMDKARAVDLNSVSAM